MIHQVGTLIGWTRAPNLNKVNEWSQHDIEYWLKHTKRSEWVQWRPDYAPMRSDPPPAVSTPRGPHTITWSITSTFLIECLFVCGYRRITSVRSSITGLRMVIYCC